ncbi:protein roadkill-like [Daphnia pulex]|uniref:protein roadkill-like n=1 Tax=Daphnia pulex TaxID=6669 RepID=UPI001EDCD48A|nr:protein roadkill-like [Daphnia pulex]
MYRFTTAIFNQRSEKISAQEVILQKNSQPSLIIFTVDKQLAVDSLLPDGSLTIHCEVEYAVGKENVSDTNEDCRGHQIECSDQFSANIGNLFNNETFSDVTFKVFGQEFKAHKNILAARSEVFAAMFEYPTKKQSSNKVEIVEIFYEPDVFEEVLRFIYTGLVPLDKMESMADLLLEAANEYSLEKLKISCENHEIHNMSADACFRHLTGTDHINPEERLKKSAILYFRRFPGKVMATDEWKEYKEWADDPVWTLIRDIMETIHLPQV